MPLTDREIIELARTKELLNPFFDYDSEKTSISRGISSAGYDLSLDDDIRVLNHHLDPELIIDPLNSNPEQWVNLPIIQDIDPKAKSVCRVAYIPPKTFFLCSSIEYVTMPDKIFGLVTGKSTMARNGLSCIATPIEPSFKGTITLEFYNHLNNHLKIFIGMGIAQLVFYHLSEKPMITYADKNGKYQNQTKGITLSR